MIGPGSLKDPIYTKTNIETVKSPETVNCALAWALHTLLRGTVEAHCSVEGAGGKELLSVIVAAGLRWTLYNHTVISDQAMGWLALACSISISMACLDTTLAAAHPPVVGSVKQVHTTPK